MGAHTCVGDGMTDSDDANEFGACWKQRYEA